MRIISSLPPEVTKLLFDAGKRIIVLVESVTAANLAYFDENRIQYQSSGQTAKLEYFSIGHQHDRHIVVKQAAKQLRCDEDDCEKRIAEREEIIERFLTDLNSAHQVIDGKRILHWVNNDHFITGRDYLFRLLTDRAKLSGLPNDIARIVQDRILGSARI